MSHYQCKWRGIHRWNSSFVTNILNNLNKLCVLVILEQNWVTVHWFVFLELFYWLQHTDKDSHSNCVLLGLNCIWTRLFEIIFCNNHLPRASINATSVTYSLYLYSTSSSERQFNQHNTIYNRTIWGFNYVLLFISHTNSYHTMASFFLVSKQKKIFYLLIMFH